MFQQFKNIDTAFKHIRAFCLIVIMASIATTCFCCYESYRFGSQAQQHIYVIANGKVLQAFATDRQNNIPVELRDHIRTFHQDFFSLDPDDKVIQADITKALYLSDNSAEKLYSDLKEQGYYANLIAANISQQLSEDSIHLDVNQYPYYFRYYGTEKLVRATSIVTRSLVTEGYIRNVSRSDNNPHGFLIERWNIIENKDLNVQNR